MRVLTGRFSLVNFNFENLIRPILPGTSDHCWPSLVCVLVSYPGSPTASKNIFTIFLWTLLQSDAKRVEPRCYLDCCDRRNEYSDLSHRRYSSCYDWLSNKQPVVLPSTGGGGVLRTRETGSRVWTAVSTSRLVLFIVPPPPVRFSNSSQLKVNNKIIDKQISELYVCTTQSR